MTELERERIMVFLGKWAKPLSQIENWYDFDDEFYIHNEDRDVKLFYGARRGAFVFKDIPYVIKFDLEDDYCDCGEELERYNSVCRIYEEASPLFLKIEEFGCFCGVRFFVQDRVDRFLSDVYSEYVFDDYERLAEEEGAAIVDEVMDCMYSIDSTSGDFLSDRQKYWLMRAVHAYGIDAVKGFAAFIEDFELNDLHCGNLGFLNGVPVVVDYAGIYDEEG